MSDKNDLTKLGESKLSRRSLLKWTGIASVPVIAGGVWSTKYLSENKNIVEASETIVPTCSTLDCGGKCMIKAHVRDGVITRISARSDKELDEANPFMKACVRGRSYRKNQYHPDRLKYPMKRVGKRGEGKFERITWEEAVCYDYKRNKTNYRAIWTCFKICPSGYSRYWRYRRGRSARKKINDVNRRVS